jgi:AraC-like DNA-binding protein
MHHPAYGRLICRYVQKRGGDVDAVLAGTGLSWAQLLREERFLNHACYASMIAAAERQLGSYALGLELCRAVQIQAHGELGMALAASADLRQALQVTARFNTLRTRALRASFREDADVARLCAWENFDLGPARVIFIDMACGSLANTIRSTFGSLPLVLELPYARTPWAERYVEIFPGGVRFEQPCAATCVPLEALASPNLTGDPVAFANALQSCERALTVQQAGDDSDLIERVRAVLLSSQGRWPTEAEMAVRFAMSPSTLVRRLRQSGQTYLSVREATRREQAEWLLSQSELPVAEIAERLGYQNASNFSAVFRRWFGVPPLSWRRKQSDPKRRSSAE